MSQTRQRLNQAGHCCAVTAFTVVGLSPVCHQGQIAKILDVHYWMRSAEAHLYVSPAAACNVPPSMLNTQKVELPARHSDDPISLSTQHPMTLVPSYAGINRLTLPSFDHEDYVVENTSS